MQVIGGRHYNCGTNNINWVIISEADIFFIDTVVDPIFYDVMTWKNFQVQPFWPVSYQALLF